MTYIKHPDQRVAVFVDVSNMFHAAKREGATLNFSALLREAVAGRKLVRAIAYAIKSDTEEEKAFFNALQEA
ncbi:NYN domain-containing protein, partial [Patescibacteria group bacterium]